MGQRVAAEEVEVVRGRERRGRVQSTFLAPEAVLTSLGDTPGAHALPQLFDAAKGICH